MFLQLKIHENAFALGQSDVTPPIVAAQWLWHFNSQRLWHLDSRYFDALPQY